MSLKYHGLFLESKQTGEFRFGIQQLISSCNSLHWIGIKDFPESAKPVIQRFHNKAYWQCSTKCHDTVNKIKRAIHYLSENIYIYEHKDEFAYSGAPMEKAAYFFDSYSQISNHLDVLIMYLRILTDCIAFAIPFFYKTKISIANRSFRDQRKWFLEKEPKFDPDYNNILETKSHWFDQLSGKAPKGIRDAIFHKFGTYQFGAIEDSLGQRRMVIQQISPDGIENPDLSITLNELILGFFLYLDATYQLFANRMKKQMQPLLSKSLEEWSLIHTYKDFVDLHKSYKLFPLIEK